MRVVGNQAFYVTLGLSRGVMGRDKRTIIVNAKSRDSAAAKVKGKGRILEVRKVPIEEMFKLEINFDNILRDNRSLEFEHRKLGDDQNKSE